MYGQRSFEYSGAQEWNTVSYLSSVLLFVFVLLCNASLSVARSVVLHNIKDDDGKILCHPFLSNKNSNTIYSLLTQWITKQSESVLLSLTKTI